MGDTVRVTMTRSNSIEVEAVHRVGLYVVHSRVGRPEEWMVTHAPTGCNANAHVIHSQAKAYQLAVHMHSICGSLGKRSRFGRPPSKHLQRAFEHAWGEFVSPE